MSDKNRIIEEITIIHRGDYSAGIPDEYVIIRGYFDFEQDTIKLFREQLKRFWSEWLDGKAEVWFNNEYGNSAPASAGEGGQMNQLDRATAEKYARACEWGHKQKEADERFGEYWNDGGKIYSPRELPLDPDFWFPKLLKQIKEVFREDGFFLSYTPANKQGVQKYCCGCSEYFVVYADVPCEALYLAIEKASAGKEEG